MSHSPSPSEQVSLDAESWTEETSPVKGKVKSLVQLPCKQAASPAATSSPKLRTSRRDPSPVKGGKRVASESVARQELPCPTKKGKRSCPLCSDFPNRPLRRHAFDLHVPAISDPAKICWACGSVFPQGSQIEKHIVEECPQGHFLNHVEKWAPLVTDLFVSILTELKLLSWDALIKFVHGHPKYLPTTSSPLSADIWMMNAYHRFMKEQPPEVYSYTPPNALPCLLHWRILGNLLRDMSWGAREKLFRLHQKPFRSSQVPTSTVSVPPQPRPVVPMAPPAQSSSQEATRQVVPRAPLAPPPIRQPRPAVRPVVPLAPPPPRYGMGNLPRMPAASSRYKIVNRPVVPLALPSQSSPVVRQLVVPPSVPLAGMDAHFHLDRLYIKMKQFHHRDVEASLWRKPKGMACQIIRAVPSYCFPEIWPSVEYLQYQLPESADRFSVGWHPTRVSDYFDARKGGKCRAEFYERVSLQRCIALGEVGVDYERERSPYGQGQQRELLRAMVQKAKALQKPLLLHIRDHNDGVSASEDCRKILIEAELPSAWPIYLHCYGYGWRELGRWFSRFTNVVVGLAPPILKNTNADFLQLLKDLDSHRYVLETDGPYFKTPDFTCYGGPGQIFQVAQFLAKLKGLPVEVILQDAQRNCVRFYNMTAQG